jgi:peroxiredoxin
LQISSDTSKKLSGAHERRFLALSTSFPNGECRFSTVPALERVAMASSHRNIN